MSGYVIVWSVTGIIAFEAARGLMSPGGWIAASANYSGSIAGTSDMFAVRSLTNSAR